MLLLSAGAGFQGQEGVGRAVAAPAGRGSSRHLGDAAALDTLRGAVGVADHHAVASPLGQHTGRQEPAWLAVHADRLAG
jgi:hypothetical protein